MHTPPRGPEPNKVERKRDGARRGATQQLDLIHQIRKELMSSLTTGGDVGFRRFRMQSGGCTAAMTNLEDAESSEGSRIEILNDHGGKLLHAGETEKITLRRLITGHPGMEAVKHTFMFLQWQ